METATIDEAKALLYGQPVESFVAERDLLVKAIRSGGHRVLANEVKTLRKPSAVAALVNQVVRADPDGVELILQAAELLRSAQAGALDGTTINASELQQQYRAAIGALAQSAPDRRGDVRAALEAATIDEASNEDLRNGCLVVVPTPVSIFGSAPLATSTTTPKTKAGKPGPTTEPLPEPVVDELEERRALRRADKAARSKAVESKAAESKAADEAIAAKEAAAAAKKAAAEAERQRKAAEKAWQRERKALQKQHRDALRSHLAALDDEVAASDAVENTEQELQEADSQINAAEQALADLRTGRDATAVSLEQNVKAKADASERATSAEAKVEALAEQLGAHEDLAHEDLAHEDLVHDDLAHEDLAPS